MAIFLQIPSLHKKSDAADCGDVLGMAESGIGRTSPPKIYPAFQQPEAAFLSEFTVFTEIVSDDGHYYIKSSQFLFDNLAALQITVFG